jgi:hypothetical protein
MEISKLFASLFGRMKMRLLHSTLVIAALGVEHIIAQGGCCSAWWFAPSGSVMTRVSKSLLELNRLLIPISLLVRCSFRLCQRERGSISFGQVRPHACSYLLKSNNVQGSSLVMETLYSKMSLGTNSNLESGLLLRGMDLTILRKFRQTM